MPVQREHGHAEGGAVKVLAKALLAGTQGLFGLFMRRDVREADDDLLHSAVVIGDGDCIHLQPASCSTRSVQAHRDVTVSLSCLACAHSRVLLARHRTAILARRLPVGIKGGSAQKLFAGHT